MKNAHLPELLLHKFLTIYCESITLPGLIHVIDVLHAISDFENKAIVAP